MIFDYMSDVETHAISLDELKFIMKRLKNNKSPGPNGIPTVFFKWLNDEALQEILSILNNCWSQETFPEDFECAEVVTLYKKGNVEDPGNYRPISRLQTMYKIFASILQKRLADSLEENMENAIWFQEQTQRDSSIVHSPSVTRNIGNCWQ